MSFFGPPAGGSGPSRGPVVHKVTVTRPVKRPLGAPPRPGVPGSAGQLKPGGPTKNGSSSGGPARNGAGASGSKGARYLDVRPGSGSGSLSTKSKSSASSSARNGHGGGGGASPSPAFKRKPSSTPMETRIESESESETDSDAGPSDADGPGARYGRQKRRRGNGHGPSATSGESGGDGTLKVNRGKMFDLDSVVSLEDAQADEGRGKRSWKGFIGAEEVARGRRRREAGDKEGEMAPVQGGARSELDKYRAYFPQDGFGKDGDELPSVELLYPASGCREKFILLTPISHREYKPMSELRNALRLILDHYVPPTHAHIFGTLSSDFDLEVPSSLPSRLQSPVPPRLTTDTPSPGSSPAPATVPPSPGVDLPGALRTDTIGDALRKALAPNRRDGPGFLRAMERYNAAMGQMQSDGTLSAWLRDRPPLGADDWSKLVDGVHDQAYSRVVGPWANELEHHPKHPDDVSRAISAKEDSYGELRHTFMSRVMEQTCLGPDQVFVDLGSGVGNCVVQAALQAGSESYGFELLPVPARCARMQLEEVKRRWAMWGLNGNLQMGVFEGDFRTHPEVGKCLARADVVLVNNEVFPPSLNADLTNMFLDLKDGAKIVSLKPFVPEGFRMTENNCDSFAAICQLTEHTYYRDWVSWKGESGKYYVQTVDRSARKKFEEDMMSGRARRR